MTSIKIIVSPKGDAKVEADGYVGATCEAATAPFLRRLGSKNLTTTLRPEYFEAVEQAKEQEIV